MPIDPLDQQLVEAVLTRPRRGKADLEEAKLAGLRPSRAALDDVDDDEDEDEDEPEIALAAGSLLPPFPGDPADRIIYSTALANNARLVTADRRMARHDPGRIVW